MLASTKRFLYQGETPARIMCLAWNNHLMNDGENQPLIFLKDINSITFEHNIYIPFRKEEVNVWCEPEIAMLYNKGELDGFCVVNDVTIEHKGSKRDHHLPINKSIKATFAMHSEYILSPSSFVDKFFDRSILLLGYVVRDMKIIEDREGTTSQLRTVGSKAYKYVDNLFDASNTKTIISLGTVNTKSEEPIFIQDNDTYVCTIEGMGSLSNRFHFLKEN